MNKKIIIGVLIGVVVIVIGLITFYYLSLTPVGKDENVTFKIEPGNSVSVIITKLAKENLIKSDLTAKIYAYLSKKSSFQVGNYALNKNMSVSEIFDKFNKGDIINENIKLTFGEEKRLVDYAKIIASKFDYTEEEILNTLKDKEYLQTLIDNNWFITEEILDEKIYYPLEGYLYPDTYEFAKDATIKDIINKLISNMGNKLAKFKDQLNASTYTPHEILTLASIIELEAATKDDRANVAQVFYNRLNNGWSLGSDVTAYYGVSKTFKDKITDAELNKCNPYNTRSNCVTKLPVGPICSVTTDAINAALNPQANDYFYFVADNTKKVYFSKTSEEQNKTISDLKKAGLWVE